MKKCQVKSRLRTKPKLLSGITFAFRTVPSAVWRLVQSNAESVVASVALVTAHHGRLMFGIINHSLALTKVPLGPASHTHSTVCSQCRASRIVESR